MPKNNKKKMNKSAARLTPSLYSTGAVFALTAAALILYFVPWVDGGSASLTFGAYDLAEWTSLHPAVRFVEPALVMTLLLRLVPALLVIGLAAWASLWRGSGRWWLTGLTVLVAAGGLLPPFEFIANTGDPNYRQQFVVALITLIGGLVAWSGLLGRHSRWITLAAAVGALICAAVGLTQALTLFAGFRIDVAASVGGPGVILCALALAILTLRSPVPSNPTRM
jgi:hypothetical protein